MSPFQSANQEMFENPPQKFPLEEQHLSASLTFKCRTTCGKRFDGKAQIYKDLVMVTVRCNLFLESTLLLRHGSRSWSVQAHMKTQTVEKGTC